MCIGVGLPLCGYLIQVCILLQVSPGSIAATGLAVGDVILQIADIDTSSLTFAQSQDLIKDCGNLLQFHIAK